MVEEWLVLLPTARRLSVQSCMVLSGLFGMYVLHSLWFSPTVQKHSTVQSKLAIDIGGSVWFVTWFFDRLAYYPQCKAGANPMEPCSHSLKRFKQQKTKNTFPSI